MRFAILPLVCLIGTAVTTPVTLEARDSAIISYNIKRVSDVLSRLGDHLNNRGRRYPGTLQEFIFEALSLNDQLAQELYYGADDIKRSPKINDIEALSVGTMLTPMIRQARDTTESIMSLKPSIPDAQAKLAIRDSLISVATQSSSFSDAIISKMSTLSAYIGKDMKRQLDSYMDRAISEYKW